MKTGTRVRLTNEHKSKLETMGLYRTNDDETGTITSTFSNKWVEVDFPSTTGRILAIVNLEKE